MHQVILILDKFFLKYERGGAGGELRKTTEITTSKTQKFVPNWFVTSKIIEKLFTDLYVDENILYFNEKSDNVIFNCNGMGICSIYFNNINLDDINYGEDDPQTIIHIRVLAWHIKFEKGKQLKKKISE